MIFIFTAGMLGKIYGTVDQVDGNNILVELSARNHIHDDVIPRWLFPCKVEEGTKFIVQSYKNKTIIKCE
jgi:hypothetical protein